MKNIFCKQYVHVSKDVIDKLKNIFYNLEKYLIIS